MYCFRCGTKVSENTKYCPHCGANVLEELERYNYPTNENIQKKEIEEMNQTHNDQYLYSLKYSFGDNDTLIRAYVGKNYEKIKKSTFSFSTFFLGPLYFFYRKLYLFGIIYIILLIIFSPIFFIIHILTSIGFKYIYFNTVKKRIEKIKQENKNTDKQTLLNICEKKGGTNIFTVIIFIVTIIFIFCAVTILVTKNILNNNNYEKLTETSNYSLENLSYTIPEGFEYYDYEFFKRYSLFTDNNFCTIRFSTTNYIDNYPTEEDYIKENVYTNEKDIVFPIDTVMINQKDWKHMKVQKNYNINNIYVLKTPTQIYEIQTEEDIGDNTCTPYFEQILSSIKYKD